MSEEDCKKKLDALLKQYNTGKKDLEGYKSEERLAIDLFKSILNNIKENQSKSPDNIDFKKTLVNAKVMSDLFSDYDTDYFDKIQLKTYPGNIKKVFFEAIKSPSCNDIDSVVKEMQNILHPKITRFEKARIIGSRALQISYGAPILADYDKKIMDSVDIAEIEFFLNLLPITCR